MRSKIAQACARPLRRNAFSSPLHRRSINPRVFPRFASTASAAATAAKSTINTASAATAAAAAESSILGTRLKNALIGTSVVLLGGFGYLYFTDTRAGIHRWLAIPLIRAVWPDAEDAHHAGTEILKTLYTLGLHPRERVSKRDQQRQRSELSVEVFGHVLDNPIAISGGLDKNAEIPTPLFETGPGIVEVGGITPLPQDGNPKPRVFRVTSQNAIINRYGLNSEGAERVALRLRQRVREFAHKLGIGHDEAAVKKVLDGEAGVPPGSLIPGRLLAVQVAKNKTTPDADIDAVQRDYVYCVQQLGRYADIIVVNVSSPNTPGLRALQSAEPLTHILQGVVQAARAVDRKTKPAVMVKVSPDEDSDEDISGICDAVWSSGVDGVIIGNTTKQRPAPLPAGYAVPAKDAYALRETGGYSGPQLFDNTLALVKKYRPLLDYGPSGSGGPKTIFASGGITTGEQALEVLNAGASVAMMYTGIVYGGVGTITRVKQEMRNIVKKN